MAQDRGGLRYKIEVLDAFSKETTKFREEIEASRTAFRAFRRTLATPISTDEVLQANIKTVRELSVATKALAKERSKAQTTTRASESAEKRLERIQNAQASRIKEIAAAARDANKIASRNVTNTEQEARIRQRVAETILRQTEALQELRILSANDRLVNGLKTEQEAWKRTEKAIQANATELAQLRQLQAQGDRNIRGEAPKDTVEKERIRLLRQLKVAEEAAKVAADERFAVDSKGQLVLAPLIQAEREYKNLLRQRAVEEAKINALKREGLGSDGLTAEQRALRGYNRELERLATNEERLRIIRERTDDNFLERSIRIKAEERATRALINTKANLQALELQDKLTDKDGRSLAELQAVETAERRIRREKERQAAAQAEINLRQAQGLPISRKLREEAAGTAKETERLNRAANRSIFSFRRLFLIFGAFEAVRAVLRSFRETVAAGVQFNSTLEQSELAISALIAATSDFPGLFGQGADAAQRLEFSLVEARKQNALLRQDALRTSATYEELVSNFQLAVAPGVSAGGSLDQIRAFTVQITQAASALGLANNQLSEEIRNIIQGTINIRTTRIAAALGITNEDIRRAREAGQLFQFLQTEFAAFNEAGIRVQQTFAGLVNRIRDAFSQITGAAATDFFDELKDGLRDVLALLGDFDTATGEIKFNEDAVAVFEAIFSALEDAVGKAREFVESLDVEDVLKAADTLRASLVSIANVALGVADGILAAFQRLNSVAEILSDIFNFDSTKGFISFLTEWVIVLGLASTVTGVLSKAWLGLQRIGAGLASVFAGIFTRITGLAFSAFNLGKAFGVLRVALVRFGTAFAAALGPIGLTVAALVGVGLSLDSLAEKMTGVKLTFVDSFKVMAFSARSFLARINAAVAGFFASLFEGTQLGNLFTKEYDRATESVERLNEKIEKVARTAENARLSALGAELGLNPEDLESLERVEINADFSEISRASSTAREQIAALAESFDNLETQARRANAELEFEVETSGSGLDNTDFQTNFELTEKTRDLTRERANLQGQINVAEREQKTLQLALAELSQKETQQVRERLDLFRARQVFEARSRDLQKEINRLRIDEELAPNEREKERISLLLQQKEAILDGVKANIEAGKSDEFKFELSKRSLALASSLIENEERRAVLAGDIVRLTGEELKLREAAARLNVTAAAGEALRRRRTLIEEQKTLEEQLRTQREITDATRAGASERRLAKVEQDANLRLLEQESRQQAILTEQQAEFFELKAQEAVLAGQFNEAAVLAATVLQLRERIRLEKALLAQKKAQVIADSARSDQDFDFQTSSNLRLNEQRVRVLEEQAYLETSLLALAREQAVAEDIALEKARGEVELNKRRASETLARLEASRDLQAREFDRLSVALGLGQAQESEVDAARRLLSLLDRELAAQRAILAAEQGQSEEAARQLEIERRISATRGVFDRALRTQDIRQESAEMEQQLRIEQTELQIIQKRASATEAELARARRRRESAELQGRILQDNLVTQLQILGAEREAAELQEDDDNVAQIDREIKGTGEKLALQIRLNAATNEQNKLLERQAELRDGPNFFRGLAEGAVEFANSLPTLFEAGANVAKASLDGLADTLSQTVLISLDPNIDDKDKAIGDAFEQLGLQIAQTLVNQLVQSLIQTALGAFSGGVALQSSATVAATTLQIGGVAAGTAIVDAATIAAGILAGTSVATGGIPDGGYTGGSIGYGSGASNSHFGPGAQGYAAGGHIRRPRTAARYSTPFVPQRPAGIDRRDTTPIWAQPGEYMMRLAAVRKYGVGFMRMLNAGAIPLDRLPAARGMHASRRNRIGYADGGLIGRSSGPAGRGSNRTEIQALPVLVADEQSASRIFAAGEKPLMRQLVKMGFRPGRN